MINRYITLTAIIFFYLLPLSAQVKKQDSALKREVTLYNPYKPSLPESKKRSFLPDMNDTTKIKPDFHYDINTKPFMPAYTVSPIKAAALLPDPLAKLYKSYINIGMGNYLTPLAEVSITNERSKKGTIGFYGRHFSTNGKVELQNKEKVFAGYMDNDVSLFGRKFFKKNLFEGSVDYSQKTRYAYGYDTSITNYSPAKEEIRVGYDNLGAKASFSSITMDSSAFAYDFNIYYNYFYNAGDLYQHNGGFTGSMAKSFKGFYVGSGADYDFDILPDMLLTKNKFIASVSPFIKKSNEQWNFKLGFKALLERSITEDAKFHLYPDVDFGFNIVHSYVSFFAGLSGKLQKNDPLGVIYENPYLVTDGSLFRLPNTDHQLIIATGLKGNNGIGGNYIISASYSLINDMLFYTNTVYNDGIYTPEKGNMFVPFTDEAELLNIHGEMSGLINDKLSYKGAANIYNYNLANYDYAWNKPGWDGLLGLKYNLRDKIIAGLEISAEGKRTVIVNGYKPLPVFYTPTVMFEIPTHVNINLSAEYRYSKILSFWAKFNNITYNRNYEWAYYPTQRFLGMIGFTYSL